MWAPLSIRGLWSRSYLCCLQEPLLIQGVVLNRCFSTRTPSGGGEERDRRGWDCPQSHFSGLILLLHCLKQRLGHLGFGQNRGWNQGLPLGLPKCSFSCSIKRALVLLPDMDHSQATKVPSSQSPTEMGKPLGGAVGLRPRCRRDVRRSCLSNPVKQRGASGVSGQGAEGQNVKREN